MFKLWIKTKTIKAKTTMTKMINLDLSISGVKKTSKFFNFFFQLGFVLPALLTTHLAIFLSHRTV